VTLCLKTSLVLRQSSVLAWFYDLTYWYLSCSRCISLEIVVLVITAKLFKKIDSVGHLHLFETLLKRQPSFSVIMPRPYGSGIKR